MNRRFSILCLVILSIASLSGMPPKSLPKPAYSHAIKEIPQYVYENCNHMVRYIWTAEKFRRLKARAETITAEEVRAETENGDAFVKQCELYDWIHCLNYIEKEVLSLKTFTVDHLRCINACLTRLLFGSAAGNFRTRRTAWAKSRTSSDTEDWFHAFMLHYSSSVNEGRIPILRFNEAYIATSELKNFFELVRVLLIIGSPAEDSSHREGLKTYPEIVDLAQGVLAATKSAEDAWWLGLVKEDGTDPAIRPEEVYDWEKELSTTKGHRKGFINYLAYINKRNHVFPPASAISGYADQIVAALNKKETASIVTPAYLWFRVIEVHLFEEANKRSGKAISLIPLLRNGYLPPLIDKEQGEEFVRILLDVFERMDSGNENKVFSPFIHFFTQAIEQTQATFAQMSIQKKCAICDATQNLKMCGICKKMYYCLAEHQKKDWPAHKNNCQKKQ